MWWTRWLLTIWAAWLVHTQEQEGRALTWAQIMASPSQKAPKVSQQNLHSPFSTSKDYTDDFTDYDDSFFSNSYYEYVDTEDPSYTPPQVPQQEMRGEVNQDANRRTLDTIFHLFMGHQNTGRGDDGRPVRDATTPRPTLIQSIFKTIDEHIVQDIQDWVAYLNRREAQTSNPRPNTGRTPTSGTQTLSAIQPASQHDDDLLLVTDEQGQQQIVTINDIVTSLSHLDEETLTDLLLSPDQLGVASERSTKTVLPPPARSPIFHEEEPTVFGSPMITDDSVKRPVRHTGPTQATITDSDDVYVVQDEHGDIQLVTVHDILASLSALDSSSVNELLFGEPDDVIDPLLEQLTPDISSLPSQVPSLTQSPEESHIPILTDTSTETTTSAPTVSPTFAPTANSATDGDLNPTEASNENLVSTTTTRTNHNVNTKGITNNGPIVLEQPKLSQNTATRQRIKPQKIGGTLIHTDEHGNIHITPDRNKPLNVQEILALAEQEQEQQTERTPSIQPNILQTRQKEQEARRSQQLLSFLANKGRPSLLAAQRDRQQATRTNNLQRQAGIHTLQQPLLRTIRQPVVEPLVKSRVRQPVILPFLQSVTRSPTIIQPVTQPPTRTLTNTLSDWFSWLVGESSEEEVEEPPPLPTPLTHELDSVQVVVQEQAPKTPDNVFGHITIPLPKPIHFQSDAPPNRLSHANINSAETDATSAEYGGNPLPPFLNNLSPIVQDSLIKQINDQPKFIPPGLKHQAQPKVTARMDEGPVEEVNTGTINGVNRAPQNRADRNPVRRVSRGPVNRRNINSVEKTTTRPIYNYVTARTAREPFPLVTSATTEAPPKLPPSFLSSLPQGVLDKIKQQLRDAQKDRLLDNLNKPSQDISQPTVDHFQPRDRSSYAHVPQDSFIQDSYETHVPVPHPGVYDDYGSDEYYVYEDETKPLFDIFLLADANIVHKYGEDNYSIRAPKIGDSSYFVDTRSHYGYNH